MVDEDAQYLLVRLISWRYVLQARVCGRSVGASELPLVRGIIVAALQAMLHSSSSLGLVHATVRRMQGYITLRYMKIQQHIGEDIEAETGLRASGRRRRHAPKTTQTACGTGTVLGLTTDNLFVNDVLFTSADN